MRFKRAGGQVQASLKRPGRSFAAISASRGGDLLRGVQRLVRFALERRVARREVRRGKNPRAALGAKKTSAVIFPKSHAFFASL